MKTAALLSLGLLLAATPALAQAQMSGPIVNQQPVVDGRRWQPDNYDVDNKGDIVDILPDEGAARGVIVTQRIRPEYQPQGIKADSFRFLPEVKLEGLYNDNIYASKNNTKSDFITIVTPRATMRSDWNNHALNFLAAASMGAYADNSDENYTDYLLQTDGRLDVTRNSKLGALLSYAGAHEERGSPNDISTQTEPVEYNVRTAQLEFMQKMDDAKVNVIYSNQDFTYDDGHTSAGTNVDNKIRDRVDNEIDARLSYEAGDGIEPFIQVGFNDRDYNGRSDRDSDGYKVIGGVRSDITGTLFGDIYAGVMSQNYKSAAYKDYDGATYGVNGYWNLSGLTTLTGNVAREVQETIAAGASNFVQTRARLNLDHELQRNIILSGLLGYATNDYSGIAREDDIWSLGAGMKYLFNQHFHAYANYTFTTQDSNVNANSYDQNKILFGIRAAL